MSSTIDDDTTGTFDLAPGLRVRRLGFGAMRITGKGIWGEPADRPEALRVLRRLPELEVNFIDTADVYNQGRSEEVVGQLLAGQRHEWVLASKIGNVFTKINSNLNK